jgi:hypothetical protein
MMRNSAGRIDARTRAAKFWSGPLSVALYLTSLSLFGAEPGLDLPAAIYTDPPSDPAHPASGQGVQFENHGSVINAQLYRQPARAYTRPSCCCMVCLGTNKTLTSPRRCGERAGP